MLVGGEPVDRLSDAQAARRIGYVFQDPDNQIVCESVWHEMAFGLENLGMPQEEMRRLVAEISYFFGMESWFRERTDALSGGRKQLLALASTLVMQPGLLLLDEPTAQLDPIAEKNFLHALFRVNRELGCTVVVATHEPRAMLDYATCAFELADGRVRRVPDMAAFAERAPLLGKCRRNIAFLGQKTGPSEDGSENPQVDERSNFGLLGLLGKKGATAPKTDLKVEKNSGALRLSLEGAWFRYDADHPWVLRNLDLQVEPGRVHALVGGNGCGKSTLLAVLAGAAKLKRGRVSGAGSSRALLPQDPKALFVAEIVADELAEWAEPAGCERATADELLESFGLAACKNLHPYDLSGGQRQLLALAKLLLLKPAVLLLDEPTKGLDLPSRRLIASALRDVAEAGAIVLMATHDLDFVDQVADTVSMMFDGEIACTQPTAEFFAANVYYRP